MVAEMQWTDYGRFMSSIRLSHDICLVGTGVHWNHACHIAWTHLWRLHTFLSQSNNETSSPVYPTSPTSPISPTAPSAGNLIKKKEGTRKTSMAVVLVDQEEAHDLCEGHSIMGKSTHDALIVLLKLLTRVGGPWLLIYIHGMLIPVSRPSTGSHKLFGVQGPCEF